MEQLTSLASIKAKLCKPFMSEIGFFVREFISSPVVYISLQFSGFGFKFFFRTIIAANP